MKFKQSKKETFNLILTAALFSLSLLANAPQAFAQFTFVGDYDRANFAAPNGYYVEPQNNFLADTTNPNRRSYLFAGDYAPDGSIIAGGRIERAVGNFWLRKFTPSGAIDTSFGGAVSGTPVPSAYLQ